jgi:hypothetical protein
MVMLKEFNWANAIAYLIMILYLVSIFNANAIQEIVQVIDAIV